jgi:hypothetical protein
MKLCCMRWVVDFIMNESNDIGASHLLDLKFRLPFRGAKPRSSVRSDLMPLLVDRDYYISTRARQAKAMYSPCTCTLSNVEWSCSFKSFATGYRGDTNVAKGSIITFVIEKFRFFSLLLPEEKPG